MEEVMEPIYNNGAVQPAHDAICSLSCCIVVAQ